MLIVEDDLQTRDMYRAALRAAGYEVGAVEDGTDALRRIDHWTPDVIVLDLALPRLDGRDLYFELRARTETRGIPIIVASGTDTSDLEAHSLAAILTKPVSPDVLVRAVDDAIRRAPANGPEPA